VALRALVTACATILRATDMFVRWGGEEFMVIMPDTSEPAAADAGERVCAEVAALRARLDDGTPIGFTVSIGVAEAPDADISCLLNRADTALYAAKRAGRNRVIVAGQEPHVPVAALA
jgi:diguanylate cyclase (GGDEF)-like protein